MKKFISIILIALMTLTFASCDPAMIRVSTESDALSSDTTENRIVTTLESSNDSSIIVESSNVTSSMSTEETELDPDTPPTDEHVYITVPEGYEVEIQYITHYIGELRIYPKNDLTRYGISFLFLREEYYDKTDWKLEDFQTWAGVNGTYKRDNINDILTRVVIVTYIDTSSANNSTEVGIIFEISDDSVEAKTRLFRFVYGWDVYLGPKYYDIIMTSLLSRYAWLATGGYDSFPFFTKDPFPSYNGSAY